MEDDLKISKVEYLSNRLYDHTQILNLDDQSKVFKYFKILKMEYISNHLLDPTQMLNLSLYVQKIFCKSLNKDDLQWKTT
jgi:hypothetical protein